MSLTPSNSRRAFAVLMVMVVITVLSILAGALAIFLKVETQLTANSNDSEKLLWLGRAGADRACWILANELGGPTTIHNKWAGGSGYGPETNGPLAGISLTGYQVGPDGYGTVDLEMVEQESMFNVNTADSELLRSILTGMGVDAGQISEVADSIQDWIDPDDASKPAGAESDFYQGMTPPYYAKNAPIDNIQELQFIKGVTTEMFKGGTADPNTPFQKHHLGFGSSSGDYPFGLRDVLTAYSSGRVNVNTAGINVLASIPRMDTNSAQAILTFRDSAGDTTGGDGVIKNLSQLQQFVPDPQAFQQLGRYCTISGNTYEVHITAHAGANTREFVAVIIRGQRAASIVTFYPK